VFANYHQLETECRVQVDDPTVVNAFEVSQVCCSPPSNCSRQLLDIKITLSIQHAKETRRRIKVDIERN
jgi:hypothetical protein